MEQVILVLILLAGPGEREVGEALARELEQRGGDRVEVLVGEPAHARLEDKWGVTAEDLTVSRQIGAQLTQHAGNLVVLHVNQREMQGDHILEVGLWLGGESERVSSIAGGEADPLPGLLSSLLPLLTSVLPERGAGEVLDREPKDVTTLIKAEEWTKAVAARAGKEDLSAREHYYRVLAYVRLGNRSAAIDALNQMQTAHGQHFLVAAAEDLIPSRGGVEEVAEDAGGEDAQGAGEAAIVPGIEAEPAPTP